VCGLRDSGGGGGELIGGKVGANIKGRRGGGIVGESGGQQQANLKGGRRPDHIGADMSAVISADQAVCKVRIRQTGSATDKVTKMRC
jgi:hypothetical protein